MAKAFAGDTAAAADSSQSPTLTKGTALGAIVGTASYMSPEQARCKPVDKRTDVWSFGCCLYEALSGKKAFEGDNVTDILTAVVHREPDVSVVPPSARRTVQRCLAKDKTVRFRSAGDVMLDIEVEEPATSELESKGHWQRAAIAFGLVGLLAGVVLTIPRTPRNPEPRPVRRTMINFPESAPLRTSEGVDLIVSPDGSRVVYAAWVDARPILAMRRLDTLEPEILQGTIDAEAVVMAPDGQQIAFLVQDKLRRLSLDGGAPVDIGEASRSIFWAGASWASNGVIYFSRAIGLSRIDVNSGASEQVTTIDAEAGERFHTHPQLLPDGDTLLFTIRLTDGTSKIGLQSLRSGERKTLDVDLGGARFVASGHLLGARSSGEVLAAPFDEHELHSRGRRLLWRRCFGGESERQISVFSTSTRMERCSMSHRRISDLVSPSLLRSERERFLSRML